MRNFKIYKTLIISILTLLFLNIATNIDANENDLPWKKDNILINSWVISKIYTHSEFIRLTLKKENNEITVEITYKKNIKSGISTKNYTIQPAPGNAFNKELINYIATQLEELENEKNHKLFVNKNKLSTNIKIDIIEILQNNKTLSILFPMLLLLLIISSLIAFLLFFLFYKKNASILLSASILAFSICLWIGIYFTSPLSFIIWITLPISLIPLIKIIKVLPKQNIIPLIVITSIAFLIRLLVPHVPANWYTDISGPFNSIQPAFIKRIGGVYLLYPIINNIIPLSDAGIFIIQILFGTFSVSLLYLALIPFQKENNNIFNILDITAIIISLLIAIDPLQARLAASDAAHVQGLFFASFAILLFNKSKNLGPIGHLSLLLCCLMPGFIRAELIFSIIIIPFISIQLSLKQIIKTKKIEILYVLISFMASLIFLLLLTKGSFIGTNIKIFSIKNIFNWITSILFKGIINTNIWQIKITYILVYIGIFLNILKKNYYPLFLYSLFLLSSSWKIFTDFKTNIPGETLVTSRYDIILYIVLLMIVAYSIISITKLILEILNKNKFFKFSIKTNNILNYSIMLFLLLVFIIFQKNNYTYLYAYQNEYLFLKKHLKKIEKKYAILTIWREGVSPNSFDTGLSQPHPLLQYFQPERKWIVLSEINTKAYFNNKRSLYFLGSFSYLDPEFGELINHKKGKEILLKTQEISQEYMQMFNNSIAEEIISREKIYWEFKKEPIKIGIYKSF